MKTAVLLQKRRAQTARLVGSARRLEEIQLQRVSHADLERAPPLQEVPNAITVQRGPTRAPVRQQRARHAHLAIIAKQVHRLLYHAQVGRTRTRRSQ